ncbi:MAG: insulinase family protein [Bacteroidetes bacterium]|nr:insulinase family protein [Bacteroidota bacterium]
MQHFMKKISLLSFLLLFCISFSGLAQQAQTLPLDPKTRIGKLDNGLTYYIRKNELPKNRGEFYIAQKVGSILEEENQRGLAHFLEHMCFNGTKNFPGNSLIKYLEKIGVKFGENVNAYTSLDETVYNLSNVPLTRETILDSALLVLHDWSSFVSLESKDIDDERGVIREEWRTRNTGGYRVLESGVKEMFANTQYANRMPIGSIDVINNFAYQAIKDYYKKWYRPDLQGIIVVGDIDVDKVEAKIKQIFSDIPAPVNPAVRTHFQVPNNTEPIVSIQTDPEVQQTQIAIYCKHDIVPVEMKSSVNYYFMSLINNLISTMFNARLFELSKSPTPPFAFARGGYGEFFLTPTKDAWSITTMPRNNNETDLALRAVIRENERMRRFGFTASEYSRAKTELLRSYETAFNEKDKQKNDAYVRECVQHFISNEPMPGIDYEFDLVNKVLPKLPLEAINKMVQQYVSDTNMVFSFTGPKKEGISTPTKEQILNAWKEVKKENITAYVDKVSNKPLIDKKPAGGKIVKTELKPFGYKQWTLSNGVKVLVKKTDYKKDQVIMSSYSPGGSSLVNDSDYPSSTVINEITTLGGVGPFSSVELEKMLTGKIVSVSPSVGALNESINGNASPKDFETLMQLTYLYFTQPRMDKDAYNSWMVRKKNQLENASLNPMNSFVDSIITVITNKNPRGKRLNLEMLKKVDYNKVMDIYKDRFADASDFTFFFTGNVEPDSIKNSVELYLGSLPAKNRKENFKDRGIYPPKGVVKNNFNKKLEVPKTTVFIAYTGEIPYTLENDILIDYVKSILDIVYTENIREKEGGSYGVGVMGSINKFPKQRFGFQINFDTDPAKREKLTGIVYDEIKKIVTDGPNEVNLNKVKENLLKTYQENLNENGYWSGVIYSQVVNGVDVNTDYAKIVKSVTPTQIRNFAKKIFSQNNIIEVSMSPEK